MGEDRRREDSDPQLSDIESQQTTAASSTRPFQSEREPHPDDPIAAATPPRRLLEVEDGDADTPTPRFMEDQGAWKRWKWVPYPMRKAGKAVAKWAVGPPNAAPYKITPLFPAVQHAPLWLLDRYLPNKRHRVWLFIGYAICWLLAFVFVMRQGLVATEVAGYGSPSDIGCGATYWLAGNQCGVDGNDCRPFNGSGFAFKCPASCASYQVLNPRAVGDQELIYQPLIVGGPSTSGDVSSAIYRGDSFICGAAIHAGVISNARGGCGVVNLVGKQENYNGSTRNSITSVGFDSYFPLSYTFMEGISCDSTDIRWNLLAVSTVFTGVLSLFTTSAPLFFFSVFTGIFWQVGMASDPPNHTSTAGLFSTILGKFLPAMFVAWVMYDKMGVRRTLQGLTAQIEKTVLWLGACWVGALTNYTFDWIPIQRLTGHDLQQQPGAKAALAIIIVVLVVIVASQIWFFRHEGRLVKYLKLYLVFIGGIIICLLLPGLSLRIHHYILGLLLLPGTSMQTRPSLLYQGVLVGLFINGIARWGFDAFLQTSAALQGDAQIGSPLPDILDPVIALGANMSTITFNWDASPGSQFDGISALVNDVERFRTYFDEDEVGSFSWTRNSTLDLPEYFRFAWMSGTDSMDYTKAGIWSAQGNWTKMAEGPSRVKVRSLSGEEEMAPRRAARRDL